MHFGAASYAIKEEHMMKEIKEYGRALLRS